jgi:hypothetical protein
MKCITVTIPIPSHLVMLVRIPSRQLTSPVYFLPIRAAVRSRCLLLAVAVRELQLVHLEQEVSHKETQQAQQGGDLNRDTACGRSLDVGSGRKLRFGVERGIALPLAKTSGFRCLRCEPSNRGLGLLELSFQIFLRHGNGIRHAGGGRRHGRSHAASGRAERLILDLSKILTACRSLAGDGDGTSGFRYTAVRSNGFWARRGGEERLAADTVCSRGGQCRIFVCGKEKHSNLLLLDGRLVGLLDVRPLQKV